MTFVVCQQPSLSEYANTLPTQPADVSVVQPSDDRFRFFAKVSSKKLCYILQK